MTGAIVIVEEALAERIGAPPDVLRVVPRRRASRWRRGRRWRPLEADRVIDTLDGAGARAVVLVRSPEADPGAAMLGPLARLLGHHVAQLPDGADGAAWTASTVASLAAGSREALGRVLDVLCCGPDASPPLPRQRWGMSGTPVPALRPETLARWAACAWRACAWCTRGGLPGRRCRTCGSPIAVDEVPA